ncbi:MAG: hypothetical protein GXY54_01995 [Deltaproteobacteria bacterium]|nr:hypothetical protein [Deltaproteobacteria bacterium]
MAASGGTTSAMAIAGLEKGRFDGVLVCNTVIKEGKVRSRFSIATTAAEILAARGSKYVESRFLQEALPLIRNFRGRLAVIGLPCDIAGLRRRCDKEPELAGKVVLTITLLCGHNSRVELIDEITARLQRETGQELVNYRFRVGHWRGRLEAVFADGSVISKPTEYFNDYQNLHFFSERKCLACHDHFGYEADISVGDVWLFRLKNDPVKHTGVIIRTHRGDEVFRLAVGCGAVQASELDIRDILNGQARSAPAHYNLSAKAKAAKLFNIQINDTVNQKIPWHAYLNALMTVGNMRLSEKDWGKTIIFRTPRFGLKFYLYLKKALESFK